MRKRILVVDDVPDWRAKLQSIFKGEYDVKTVDNYEDALEVIREREAELVIVDLRLNATDETNREGMELLKQLAERRINSIVLTGYPERELQEKAEKKYNAFDFIDKASVAGNLQRLRDAVREVFSIMEGKQEEKEKAIKAVSAGQSSSFSPDLASWPARKYRKK
jgi:DNA-binding NtrC family response regulator